jgi:hypothetical protein
MRDWEWTWRHSTCDEAERFDAHRSVPQNPSLTFMALTARTANYAVQQMKAGAI